MAAGQATLMLEVLAPSRASSLPQGFAVVARFVSGTNHCGSRLARDGGGSGDIDVGSAGPLREQARSHRVLRWSRGLCLAQITVGAGLPAMAAGQATLMLGVLAPSRASSLPQGFAAVARSESGTNHCGSGLARDGGGSGDIDVGCAGPFASKLAPTGFCDGREVCVWHKSLWERACPRWRRVRRH